MTSASRRRLAPRAVQPPPARRPPDRAPAGVSAQPSGRSRATSALDPYRKLPLPAGDRRSQILAAALQIFSEQGFHGTRTRELAERAGVSEALVFSHFPTKESILRAILDVLDFE